MAAIKEPMFFVATRCTPAASPLLRGVEPMEMLERMEHIW